MLQFQQIHRLADLPASAWAHVSRPSAGYNYRTLVEVGGVAYETLLDTGAATSVISEETLCGIINTTRGAEPPVAGLVLVVGMRGLC